MSRFITAIAIFFLATSAEARCSNADNCGDCLSNSKCTWFADIQYCEDGCGMDGCGAEVCASDLDTCDECLGGMHTKAKGQYSWSPFSGAAGECIDDCMEAPADAPCYKAKSATDPSGYRRSICPKISVCTSKNSCDDCLEGGACAWSVGSCYDSCNDSDVPADAACYEGKIFSPSDACDNDEVMEKVF